MANLTDAELNTLMQVKANLYNPSIKISDAGDLVTFDGDPNDLPPQADPLVPGHEALRNAFTGSLYHDNDANYYKKKSDGTWEVLGSGGSGLPPLASETQTQTVNFGDYTHFESEVSPKVFSDDNRLILPKVDTSADSTGMYLKFMESGWLNDVQLARRYTLSPEWIAAGATTQLLGRSQSASMRAWDGSVPITTDLVSSGNCWFIYDFEEPVRINGYTHCIMDGAGYPRRALAWRIEGSNDSLIWNRIDEERTVTTVDSAVNEEWPLPIQEPYRYYRITYLETANATHLESGIQLTRAFNPVNAGSTDIIQNGVAGGTIAHLTSTVDGGGADSHYRVSGVNTFPVSIVMDATTTYTASHIYFGGNRLAGFPNDRCIGVFEIRIGDDPDPDNQTTIYRNTDISEDNIPHMLDLDGTYEARYWTLWINSDRGAGDGNLYIGQFLLLNADLPGLNQTTVTYDTTDEGQIELANADNITTVTFNEDLTQADAVVRYQVSFDGRRTWNDLTADGFEPVTTLPINTSTEIGPYLVANWTRAMGATLDFRSRLAGTTTTTPVLSGIDVTYETKPGVVDTAAMVQHVKGSRFREFDDHNVYSPDGFYMHLSERGVERTVNQLDGANNPNSLSYLPRVNVQGDPAIISKASLTSNGGTTTWRNITDPVSSAVCSQATWEADGNFWLTANFISGSGGISNSYFPPMNKVNFEVPDIETSPGRVTITTDNGSGPETLADVTYPGKAAPGVVHSVTWVNGTGLSNLTVHFWPADGHVGEIRIQQLAMIEQMGTPVTTRVPPSGIRSTHTGSGLAALDEFDPALLNGLLQARAVNKFGKIPNFTNKYDAENNNTKFWFGVNADSDDYVYMDFDNGSVRANAYGFYTNPNAQSASHIYRAMATPVGGTNQGFGVMRNHTSTSFANQIGAGYTIARSAMPVDTEFEMIQMNVWGSIPGVVFNNNIRQAIGELCLFLDAPQTTAAEVASTNTLTQVNMIDVTQVNDFILHADIPAGTEVRILCSFDGGVTWRTFQSNRWVGSTFDDIAADGMTEEEVRNALKAWTRANGATLDFAFGLVTDDINKSPVINGFDVTVIERSEKADAGMVRDNRLIDVLTNSLALPAWNDGRTYFSPNQERGMGRTVYRRYFADASPTNGRSMVIDAELQPLEFLVVDGSISFTSSGDFGAAQFISLNPGDNEYSATLTQRSGDGLEILKAGLHGEADDAVRTWYDFVKLDDDWAKLPNKAYEVQPLGVRYASITLSRDPTAADDLTSEREIVPGVFWVNDATGAVWKCLDNARARARWTRMLSEEEMPSRDELTYFSTNMRVHTDALDMRTGDPATGFVNLLEDGALVGAFYGDRDKIQAANDGRSTGFRLEPGRWRVSFNVDMQGLADDRPFSVQPAFLRQGDDVDTSTIDISTPLDHVSVSAAGSWNYDNKIVTHITLTEATSFSLQLSELDVNDNNVDIWIANMTIEELPVLEYQPRTSFTTPFKGTGLPTVQDVIAESKTDGTLGHSSLYVDEKNQYYICIDTAQGTHGTWRRLIFGNELQGQADLLDIMVRPTNDNDEDVAAGVWTVLDGISHTMTKAGRFMVRGNISFERSTTTGNTAVGSRHFAYLTRNGVRIDFTSDGLSLEPLGVTGGDSIQTLKPSGTITVNQGDIIGLEFLSDNLTSRIRKRMVDQASRQTYISITEMPSSFYVPATPIQRVDSSNGAFQLPNDEVNTYYRVNTGPLQLANNDMIIGASWRVRNTGVSWVPITQANGVTVTNGDPISIRPGGLVEIIATSSTNVDIIAVNF